MGGARIAICAIAAVAAVSAVPAAAQDEERPRIRIEPRVIVYGEAAEVHARLVNQAGDAGTPVALLERRLPGDGQYREVARVRADADGAVRFDVRPESNAYFAVRTRQEPVQTSLGLLVRVRPQVQAMLSNAAPRKRARVAMSGTIVPAVGEAEVTAQRRVGETWKVVGTTTAQTLASGGDGASQSTYEVAFRVRKSGRYRVAVAPTDALSRGSSKVHRIRVGARSPG